MSVSEISHQFLTMSTSETKKIVLRSSDGATFEVDESIALKMQTIAHVIEEDDCVNLKEVPLPNETGDTLVKLLEYCARHVGDEGIGEEEKEDLKKWDAEFMNTDNSTIFDLMLAANYLSVRVWLNLLVKRLLIRLQLVVVQRRFVKSLRLRMILHLRKKKKFVERINGLLNDAEQCK